MTTELDNDKRRTLKVLAGATATGLLASMPLTAAGLRSTSGEVINCTLISRADISRVHLLMHNKTKADVAVVRFEDQIIRYDNTNLYMAAAYTDVHQIQSNDRVMVRLNTGAVDDASIQATGIGIVDMSANTSYLPQGTRVVQMSAYVKNGVATIANTSVIT